MFIVRMKNWKKGRGFLAKRTKGWGWGEEQDAYQFNFRNEALYTACVVLPDNSFARHIEVIPVP